MLACRVPLFSSKLPDNGDGTFTLGIFLIKPSEENSTPVTLKAFLVSLVEPVAYLLSYQDMTGDPCENEA